MTTIENSGSPKTSPAKTGWVRRTVMGTAVAAVAMVTLGAATTPAQAWWYHGYYHPYYVYYHPYHYGWYNYHPVYWGWGGGWGWHHWHHW